MGNRIDGHGLYMQIGLCRRVLGNGNGRWMLCITDPMCVNAIPGSIR